MEKWIFFGSSGWDGVYFVCHGVKRENTISHHITMMSIHSTNSIMVNNNIILKLANVITRSEV